MTMRIAVALSGRGSNLEALHRALEEDGAAQIVVVLSDRPDAGGLERARQWGIATEVLPNPNDGAVWIALLRRYAVDLVVLAGYVKLVPSNVIAAFRGRIINVHPALLPAFGGKGMYGRHVHEAVLAYGAKVSGCTVHFADNEYDHGPIVMKETVPVLPGDTASDLAARVFALECDLYPRAIAHYLTQHPDLIRRSGRGDWR